MLDDKTYLHHAVDGEGAAKLSCQVVGDYASAFTFEGQIQLGAKALTIKNGQLGTDHQGAATISLTDTSHLPTTLTSFLMGCSVDASTALDGHLQVKPGSMWASFQCATVEAPPSDLCAAEGLFVLENCAQD